MADRNSIDCQRESRRRPEGGRTTQIDVNIHKPVGEPRTQDSLLDSLCLLDDEDADEGPQLV